MDNDFKYKKAYGQNFLHDNNVICNIVKESNILDNSLVIEIGPGSGNLTRELARYAKNVLCYEIDNRLEDILDANLKDFRNIDIIYDDFLVRNIKDDIKNYNYDHLYVVANLPYYITTPIITHLIESKVTFDGITIMIQKEVGERFTAHVGSRDYSSITVFLNYYFDIRKLFIVKRDSFIPKPNIDSIVIRLISNKEKYNVLDENLFFQLVRDSFKYKRKTLRNNLKDYDLKVIESVLQKYDLDLMIRAERIDINLFIEISNALSNASMVK